VSLRPFLYFVPLFTNVLGDAFSEHHIDNPSLPTNIGAKDCLPPRHVADSQAQVIVQ
jgi:hypothetical protein